MRSTISLFLLLLFFSAHSEEFTVFEKEGYYGIKDERGQITVPAVYQKLGWSNGDSQVFNGVIGYKNGNNWGLISAKNKPLTEQKFFSLQPFKKGYVKGSIKGRFSNHLFYGLLDLKGKTVVSFNYFNLDQFNEVLSVSQFTNGRQLHGLISMKNEILIPLEYKKIRSEDDFQLTTTFNHTIDVYHNYSLVESSLDSLQMNRGMIGFRTGYSGYINEEGITSQPFKFKSIQFVDGVAKGLNFPTWKIYLDQELQFEQQCDSLRKTKNKIWISFFNGAQHVTLPDNEKFDSKNHIIKSIKNNYVIIQHSKTRKFSTINTDGKFIISGYDSIAFSESHFIALKKNKWSIINSSGTQLHRVPFSQIIPGSKNCFIVMKNDHWGIIDFNGDTYINFKYDSIVPKEKHYEVKYLDKWGALDFYGNWIVQPDYSEIQSFGEVVIGRRGLGYSIFHNGQFKFKTINRPLKSLDGMVIMISDSGHLGLINRLGKEIAETHYEEIIPKNDLIALKRGNYSELITKSGKKIFDVSDRVEEIGLLSNHYLAIKKNGRWGFTDESGELKIANRYDSAYIFKEGLAAIKLRDRWGFINQNERLIIQPYYDQFSSFRNGLAIVTSNNKYGLIKKNGDTQLALAFKSIERLSTENYKIEDEFGNYGLADAKGKFLIRPTYSYIQDTGAGIIIHKNDQWGFLDYYGNQIFKLQYKDIQIIENFMLIKS